MAGIRQSTRDYEAWLRRELGRDVVEKDLREKHEKMRESAFSFLRATYWRWAETVLEVCPDAADAPPVLAVGDVHLENFGTWRDADGRLVWGVNDFDEAAEMPYVLDLMRLATSALVAGADSLPIASGTICSAILQGYRRGPGRAAARRARSRRALAARAGRGFRKAAREILEEDRQDRERARAGALSQGPRGRHAGEKARHREDRAPGCRRRQPRPAALGRRRRLARGTGGARGQGAGDIDLAPAAHGKRQGAHALRGDRQRALSGRIDPWYRITDGIVVRRLSPNNRKIEAQGNAAVLALRADAAGDGPRAGQRAPRHWNRPQRRCHRARLETPSRMAGWRRARRKWPRPSAASTRSGPRDKRPDGEPSERLRRSPAPPSCARSAPCPPRPSPLRRGRPAR